MLLTELNWGALNEETGIPLAIMGLVVVFVALLLVRMFIGTLPRVIALLQHFYPEEKEEAVDSVANQATEEIPEEVLAVIAAVVADVVGVPHRIMHTRQLPSTDMSWTLEGRLQHHASHRIQPQNRK